MALAIDTTGSVSSTGFTGKGTTSTFTTAGANELLLARFTHTTPNGATISGMGDSSGLTWTRIGIVNTQTDSVELWRTFAAAKLTGVTVAGTSSSASGNFGIFVTAFTGMDTTGANGAGAIGAVGSANSASGAGSIQIVTTRDLSWVFGALAYHDTTVGTVGAGQTKDFDFVDSSGFGYGQFLRRTTTSTPSGGTVPLFDTGPGGEAYNMIAVEILPALAATNKRQQLLGLLGVG